MGIGNLFGESCSTYFSFFAWRDCVEIFFFSLIFFVIHRWLARDLQRPLVRYVYLFLGLVFCASWFQLPTILVFLLVCSPALCIFFLLIHQETLQKNVVVPHHIIPATTDSADWIEELVPACLYMLNKKKSALIIIEHEHSLEQFMHCPFRINSKLSKDFLVTLFESAHCNLDKAVWITSSGFLQGINVIPIAATQQEQALNEWYSAFLPLIAHSDALVLYANQTNELFEVLMKDTVARGLSATSIVLILKKFISNQPLLAGESGYDVTYEKKASQKHTLL